MTLNMAGQCASKLLREAEEATGNTETRKGLALAGIGWAVLDLASAVREAAESREAQT